MQGMDYGEWLEVQQAKGQGEDAVTDAEVQAVIAKAMAGVKARQQQATGPVDGTEDEEPLTVDKMTDAQLAALTENPTDREARLEEERKILAVQAQQEVVRRFQEKNFNDFKQGRAEAAAVHAFRETIQKKIAEIERSMPYEHQAAVDEGMARKRDEAIESIRLAIAALSMDTAELLEKGEQYGFKQVLIDRERQMLDARYQKSHEGFEKNYFVDVNGDWHSSLSLDPDGEQHGDGIKLEKASRQRDADDAAASAARVAEARAKLKAGEAY